jgi:hypothetical protein
MLTTLSTSFILQKTPKGPVGPANPKEPLSRNATGHAGGQSGAQSSGQAQGSKVPSKVQSQAQAKAPESPKIDSTPHASVSELSVKLALGPLPGALKRKSLELASNPIQYGIAPKLESRPSTSSKEAAQPKIVAIP